MMKFCYNGDENQKAHMTECKNSENSLKMYVARK